jgi:hypothetical protein
MSTAAVSSTSIFQELQSFQQSRQSDLQQLGSALKSGNLNGAQQAYTTLAALGENGPFANSEPFSKSSRVQAFNALGEALQAGDLTRAQTAFAALSGSQSSSTTAPVTPIATPIATAPASIVNLGGTQAAASTTGSTSSIYQQIQAYQQQKHADLTQLGEDLTAGNQSAAQQDFNTLTALGQSGPNAQGQIFQNSTRAQDFQAIGQALQAGDLAGAQSDFANLSATFGKQSQTPPAAGPAPVVPPIAEEPNATGGIDEIVINLGSPSSASSSSGATTPEIVINLGQTSGSSSTSPEEITINLGGASSTSASSSTTPSTAASTISTTPEIVLNLGQTSGTSSGSPEEITINFGTGSAGAQITIGDNQGQNGNSGPQQTINLNPQGNYELILNLLSANSTSQTPSSSSSTVNLQA